MTPLDEIRRLYFATTRATVQKDLKRAVELLKAMPSDDARQRAAVYMDGLSQMRSEWAGRTGPPGQTRRKGPKTRRPS